MCLDIYIFTVTIVAMIFCGSTHNTPCCYVSIPGLCCCVATIPGIRPVMIGAITSPANHHLHRHHQLEPSPEEAEPLSTETL